MSGHDAGQSTGPNLRSFEADLFGPLLGFHEKAIQLLRNSGLGDDKLTLVGKRTTQLTDRIVDEMQQTQSFNLAERLDAAYTEIKQYVDELSERRGDGEQ